VTELLHPALANERGADVQGRCACTQTNGEPERTTILLDVDHPSTGEQRATLHLRKLWWEAHYWGRPSRTVERDLAMTRAVVTLPKQQALQYLRRSLKMWIGNT
jgi:hypothetical protein